MFSPPRITMSLMRSLMEIQPSASISATSPVRNQPSTIASSVASGRFKYPFITFGPRSSNSPLSSDPSVSPASLMTLASMHGTSGPTEDGLAT